MGYAVNDSASAAATNNATSIDATWKCFKC